MPPGVTMPAPPCQVAIASLSPLGGPPGNSDMSLNGLGVVSRKLPKNRHAPSEQPAHDPAPTVFWWLMMIKNEKYSWPVTRSAAASGGTAEAALIRAMLGGRKPLFP